MSSTDGEIEMSNLTDKVNQQRLEERLEKDVAAVKNDIAALTDQITDALNALAGTAGKQARRGFKQARANVDSAVEDVSERGSALARAFAGCVAPAVVLGRAPDPLTNSQPDRRPTPIVALRRSWRTLQSPPKERTTCTRSPLRRLASMTSVVRARS